ncbi:hypothetical protein [Streptomyces sp. NPDC096324]|uniref:hypothetical protein n=1 Tax=Streptomyces sp. NPDC096324 TaxID=3366085 RepID=UPI00381DB18F
MLQADEKSHAREDSAWRLTPAADTNEREQQRSAPDLSGRSTEAQTRRRTLRRG